VSCQLCSTRYTAVRIHNCLKRTLVIKVATTKLQTISVKNESHHMPATKSILFVVTKIFVVRKDKWDTKEGTGKSMKNAALHV